MSNVQEIADRLTDITNRVIDVVRSLQEPQVRVYIQCLSEVIDEMAEEQPDVYFVDVQDEVNRRVIEKIRDRSIV